MSQLRASRFSVETAKAELERACETVLERHRLDLRLRQRRSLYPRREHPEFGLFHTKNQSLPS